MKRPQRLKRDKIFNFFNRLYELNCGTCCLMTLLKEIELPEVHMLLNNFIIGTMIVPMTLCYQE